jgi:hypothetical protein
MTAMVVPFMTSTHSPQSITANSVIPLGLNGYPRHDRCLRRGYRSRRSAVQGDQRKGGMPHRQRARDRDGCRRRHASRTRPGRR